MTTEAVQRLGRHGVERRLPRKLEGLRGKGHLNRSEQGNEMPEKIKSRDLVLPVSLTIDLLVMMLAPILPSRPA